MKPHPGTVERQPLVTPSARMGFQVVSRRCQQCPVRLLNVHTSQGGEVLSIVLFMHVAAQSAAVAKVPTQTSFGRLVQVSPQLGTAFESVNCRHEAAVAPAHGPVPTTSTNRILCIIIKDRQCKMPTQEGALYDLVYQVQILDIVHRVDLCVLDRLQQPYHDFNHLERSKR